MSLVREPNGGRSVFAEAMLAVVSIERRHSVLPLNAEVKRLLGEHPGCMIAFDELRNYLIRCAVRRRVAIEIG